MALSGVAEGQLPKVTGWQNPAAGVPTPILVNGQPPAAMPATESVEMFDPRAVQLSWHERRWLLVHQGQTLKDFGSHVEEAKFALRLILELGLNQHYVIGSPVPHLEFWLVDGHAPGALPRSRMQTFSIEPGRMRVDQVQNQWCILDGKRVLFNFAQYADEARQALALIQKHRFTQVGFVGQVMPSMIVFGGSGQSDTPTMAAAHGASMAGHPTATQKFSRLAKDEKGTPRFEQVKQNSNVQAAGYEGIAPPLIPALFVSTNVRANSHGESATLANQRAVGWRTQPHFGHQEHSPAASPTGQIERHGFDWRQVQLRQDNGVWKLTVGSQQIASFGTNFEQSKMGLAAIRYYRFHELHVVAGGETPAYFLANATSPLGIMLGLHGTEFLPEKLEVQHNAAGYAICQGPLVVLQFRDRPEPARQVLESIQRQKLDRMWQVGEEGKNGMTILVRSRRQEGSMK